MTTFETKPKSTENWREADDRLIKQELLELADICDEVAIKIEDRMTAG
jgi:hypothetical protein